MDTFSFILILNIVFFVSLLIFNNIIIAIAVAGIFLFILAYLVKNKKISNEKASDPFSARFSLVANRQYIVTIISLLLFMLLEGIIGFNAALVFGFLLFSYFNKLDSRASFVVALALLITTAVLSINHSLKSAESTAIMTYYFLVIGTIWLMIEVRKEKEV